MLAIIILLSNDIVILGQMPVTAKTVVIGTHILFSLAKFYYKGVEQEMG